MASLPGHASRIRNATVDTTLDHSFPTGWCSTSF